MDSSSLNEIKANKLKYAFFFGIIVLAVLLASILPTISIPVVVAYIITLMIRPLFPLLYNRNIKKRFFYIGISVFMLFLFIYPVVQILPKIHREASNIQYYLPRLEVFLREKQDIVLNEVKNRIGIKIERDFIDDLKSLGNETTKTVFLYVPTFLRYVFEWSLLIPIFIFFLIRDGKKIRRTFLTIVPNPIFEKTYFLFHQFNKKFGDYIFAKFIEASIVGLITTVGLLIIGYPFAFLLGLISGITNIVPYLGPVLGFVPALIIGLVDDSSNLSLGAVFLLYVIANVADLALVFPILVSKIVNIHPAIVIVSVMIGSQFGGILGMVLSIPMAAFLKLLLTEIYLGIYPQDLSS